MAAIEACDYKPDAVASGLRRGVTRTIGIVVSDIVNPLFAEIVEGLEERLREDGYWFVLAHSHGDPEHDVESIRLLQQRRVDGLVLSVADETQPALLDILSRLRLPVVLLDREIEGWTEASAVLSDHRPGVAQVTGDLLDAGHTRVALISGSAETRPGRERLAGFREAFMARGLSPDSDIVQTGAMSVRAGQDAAREVLSRHPRPTAIITGANLQLVGVLKTMQELGLRVGKDVALAACDDVPIASLYAPPITVVARDTRQLGREAADLLLERLGDPARPARTIHLPTHVLTRASTQTLGAPEAGPTTPVAPQQP
ncbi:substrate-binding domain-containing protein [Ornithinimicrobium sp. EGI L100131]|nr:substrate-binding domain-containing protein [Ornithinimicrobium sediminis]